MEDKSSKMRTRCSLDCLIHNIRVRNRIQLSLGLVLKVKVRFAGLETKVVNGKSTQI